MHTAANKRPLAIHRHTIEIVGFGRAVSSKSYVIAVISSLTPSPSPEERGAWLEWPLSAFLL
jgi:hypothetical protein